MHYHIIKGKRLKLMPSLLDVHVPTIFIPVFLVRKSKPPSWLSQLDSIDFIFFLAGEGADFRREEQANKRQPKISFDLLCD